MTEMRIHYSILGYESNEWVNSPTQVVPPCYGNTTLSFDGKPSPDNPRTPTLVPRSGVLTLPNHTIDLDLHLDDKLDLHDI